MNDITVSTGPDGKETAYYYDQFLQLAEITGPNGIVAQYEYDKIGRRIKEIDSAGRVAEYNYESFSKDSVTDNSGKTTTRGYDEYGRLTKITYNDGSYHSYTYNQCGTTITQPGERMRPASLGCGFPTTSEIRPDSSPSEPTSTSPAAQRLPPGSRIGMPAEGSAGC